MNNTSEKPKNTVYDATAKILGSLAKTLETGRTKAVLARLRNSIGRDISQTSDVWPEVFANMPERFLSQDGNPTDEEKAIFAALQLYALHQQGRNEPVHECFKSEKTNELSDKKSSEEQDERQLKSGSGFNIGNSLSSLSKGEASESIDKRFNAMITSATFEEMLVHLRHLISILKSKDKTQTVDYARLADDFFWFLKNSKEQVRLRWGEGYYYRTNKKQDEKGVKND
ncbi:MAG: type I-E CRISPR-associated protein Cse2/CasB [Candidatus Riflebacteria bacterium]|nr:type I-E CRISPR-associated protein Cse2/CasB [Candidatus Riflebacteria bacterium]